MRSAEETGPKRSKSVMRVVKEIGSNAKFAAQTAAIANDPSIHHRHRKRTRQVMWKHRRMPTQSAWAIT